jgi:hypothetical protein
LDARALLLTRAVEYAADFVDEAAPADAVDEIVAGE